MAVSGSAAASSFSLEGELEMGFFPGQEDAYHTRINGERIETVIARMLGFPSEQEMDLAIQEGVSADPNIPSVVRKVARIHLSAHVDDDTSEVPFV